MSRSPTLLELRQQEAWVKLERERDQAIKERDELKERLKSEQFLKHKRGVDRDEWRQKAIRAQRTIEFLDPAMKEAVAENSKTKLKLREAVAALHSILALAEEPDDPDLRVGPYPSVRKAIAKRASDTLEKIK